MRLLLKRMVLLSLLLLTVLTGLWRLLPVDQDHFFAATIDKHRRLAQASSPKIVLVGGSNLACGVDSERLQQALHQPVVNMGLHADIGLAYMLAEIRDHLSSGDQVIIVPEYEQFFGLRNGHMGVLKVMSYQRRGWRHLHTCGQWQVVILQALNYLQGKVKYALEEVFRVPRDAQYQIYHRGGFNEFGDLIAHLDRPRIPLQEKTMPLLKEKKFDRHCLALINQFDQEMRKKSVRVCIIYPGYYDRLLRRNEKAMTAIRHAFSQLACPILGTPERYAFPQECFYDTEYHLNRVGRALRTQRMIEDLSGFVSIGER